MLSDFEQCFKSSATVDAVCSKAMLWRKSHAGMHVLVSMTASECHIPSVNWLVLRNYRPTMRMALSR